MVVETVIEVVVAIVAVVIVLFMLGVVVLAHVVASWCGSFWLL